MVHLLNIVKQAQQQAPIDEEKLRILCLQRNIWDHFGISCEEFSVFPESRELQLLRKFYLDLASSLATSTMNPTTSSHIDSSIGSGIQNSSSITMRTKNGEWLLRTETKGQNLPYLLKTKMVLKRASTCGQIFDTLGLSPAIFL